MRLKYSLRPKVSGHPTHPSKREKWVKNPDIPIHKLHFNLTYIFNFVITYPIILSLVA
uniref:Uncharacterized protein n=1 Tax=Anguilla anguilla TaxID=7936 RepID=A0A0E9QYU4_ANGAN